MVRSIIAKLLVDVLSVLKGNPDFFGLPEQDRKKLLTDNIPEALKAALITVDEADFMGSLEMVLDSGANNSKNYEFAKAMAVAVSEQVSGSSDEKMKLSGGKVVQKFLNRTFGTDHYLVVQSPIRLTAEKKAEIRKGLREKYDRSVHPLFQTNRLLIGGLRVFYNGEVQDHSWLGRINVLTSIVS